MKTQVSDYDQLFYHVYNIVALSSEKHNETMPLQPSPQAWHVMYADRYTCQEEEMNGVMESVGFQITMLNPDSAGNPLDHFSAEEAGESDMRVVCDYVCNYTFYLF